VEPVNSDLETRRGLAGTRRSRRTPLAIARRLLAPLLAASLAAGCGYGRIEALNERALEARSDIEVQLLRRAELVPTLVETVQRYIRLDSTVVDAVADSRVGLAAAVRSNDLAAMESSSVSLSAALNELLASVADFADLQTDPGFQRLLVQLEDTRDQVALAGRSYNEAVRLYNEYIGGFPQVLTAKVIGAGPRQPYGTADAAGKAPPADG
jgi:LemA protein